MSLKVLCIVGSLRRQSFNLAVARATQALAPEGMHIELCLLHGLPLLNEDEEADPPPVLTAFREKLRAADAILFVSPEYNASVPGVLKNAIDWGSRGGNDWAGKPVAIMGATNGQLGTSRMQYDLKKIMGALGTFVMPKPDIFIGGVVAKLDADGNLADAKTRELIGKQLTMLADWARRVRG